MKKIIIKLIKLYQKIPFKSHSYCKFVPTCSNYAIYVIENNGVIKGSYLALKRIISCNPFSKGNIK